MEMKPDQPPRSRRREIYVGWLVLVIAAGLATRWKGIGLPPFVAKYSGDALWAMMLFVGFGIVQPKRSTVTNMMLAAAFSCAVEFSQLYHAPWIDAIRRTTPGHLVLGETFAWGDIAAYLVGIAVGGAIEWMMFGRRRS